MKAIAIRTKGMSKHRKRLWMKANYQSKNMFDYQSISHNFRRRMLLLHISVLMKVQFDDFVFWLFLLLLYSKAMTFTDSFILCIVGLETYEILILH